MGDYVEMTPAILQELRSKFYTNPQNVLAQNICTKVDPLDACALRKSAESTNHVFTHKVELEGKPMSDQKKSGRCWIFATLNIMRMPIMKHLNVEEFEFSQSYLFFWDKVERCNYFLNNMVNVAKKGEVADGRLMSFLLSSPMEDGGQWDMLVNLINRHGLVPKVCFPDSFNTENSHRMDSILTTKLREYAKDLHNAVAKGASDTDLEELIKQQMIVLFRIIAICLGVPSETMMWEYYDKSKNYNCIGPITPLEFYQKHVKPHFNVDEKICLVSDPRSSNPFGKCYTVDYLGNCIGGKLTIYNNQPIDDLLKFIAESIKNNEAVWFGCDVGKRASLKLGYFDLKCHDYNLVFGTEVQISMPKSERVMYKDSVMQHAMVFTAVTLNKEGIVEKLRVENSWGTERGDKGYHVMTADWFKEFGFEIVVDKKYVPAEVLAVYNEKPIVLPAWDPMGMLAH